MKNLGVTIFVLLIVVVLVLYLFSFQVRETEQAVVTTWGKPTEVPITEPGWKFKWPAPIQRVYKFDSRPYVYTSSQEETNTRGGEPIIITDFIVWRIEDCSKFFVTVGDVDKAENLLSEELRHVRNSVVGQHYFSEFVNSDPDQVKIGMIENQMLEQLQSSAMESYGVKVSTVGIKKLGVNEKVTEQVFERMRADRERKTQAILEEGKALAKKIRTDADAMVIELKAAAQARAQAIRGQGDAEAAKYLKLLEADPDFAIFLRDTEVLRKALEERSTIILDDNTEPIQLLREVPDIEPKQ